MPNPLLAARAKRDHQVRWLRDLLRAEVLSGRFTDGVLPAEAQLMLQYGSTRATVRAALESLRHDGLIERLHGAGTFAVAERLELRLVELHGVDATPSDDAGFGSEVLDMQVVPMPAPVAAYLDEPHGAPCLRLEYLGYQRNRVIALCTNYLRFPEADAVRATPFRSHWYQLMADARLAVGSTDLLIEAILADDHMAELLDVEVGSAVLAAQQVIRDETGRPYDFAILRSRADRMALMARGDGTPRDGAAS